MMTGKAVKSMFEFIFCKCKFFGIILQSEHAYRMLLHDWSLLCHCQTGLWVNSLTILMMPATPEEPASASVSTLSSGRPAIQL